MSVLRKETRQWDYFEFCELRRLRRSNLSVAVMAKRLSRSKDSVKSKLYQVRLAGGFKPYQAIHFPNGQWSADVNSAAWDREVEIAKTTAAANGQAYSMGDMP